MTPACPTCRQPVRPWESVLFKGQDTYHVMCLSIDDEVFSMEEDAVGSNLVVGAEESASLPGSVAGFDDFGAFLAEMQRVHDAKGKGYDGGKLGSYVNHREAAEFAGIPPWVSPLLRVREKMQRLQSAIADPSAEINVLEEMLDGANLFGIAAVLYSQWKQSRNEGGTS